MNSPQTKPAIRAALALSGLLFLTGAGRAVTVSTDDKGVRVDAGAIGLFVLEYPTLRTDTPGRRYSSISQSMAPMTVHSGKST